MFCFIPIPQIHSIWFHSNVYNSKIIITVITWLLFISISLCYKVGFTVIISFQMKSHNTSTPMKSNCWNEFNGMLMELNEWKQCGSVGVDCVVGYGPAAPLPRTNSFQRFNQSFQFMLLAFILSLCCSAIRRRAEPKMSE